MSVIILLLSLLIILIAAGLFTNGIEWLGKKLNLSEGAVGSVLAAVGTALPESMIPVIAIVTGDLASHHVGIGAILGAPFMLATLAFFVVGLSAVCFKKRRRQGRKVSVDPSIFRRDVRFFLLVFALSVGMAFVPWMWLRYLVAVFLVVLYVTYVYHTVRDGRQIGETEVEPLVFARHKPDPSLWPVLLQVLVSLVMIAVAAKFFVNSMTTVAEALHVSPLVLSLLITPVATELPEKFNSILWVREGKDTLALGNITGAMVFQSSMIPALGIAFTSWELNLSALLSAVLALLSSLIVFISSYRYKELHAGILIFSGSFYLVFVAYVLLGMAWGWPIH